MTNILPILLKPESWNALKAAMIFLSWTCAPDQGEPWSLEEYEYSFVPIEDYEWATGIIDGPCFVGLSKGGWVMICSDWESVLNDVRACWRVLGDHRDKSFKRSCGYEHSRRSTERQAWMGGFSSRARLFYSSVSEILTDVIERTRGRLTLTDLFPFTSKLSHGCLETATC